MGLPDSSQDLSAEMEVDAFRRIFPLRFFERHLSESLRPDGRPLGKARDTIVDLGLVSTADGSALAKIDSTTDGSNIESKERALVWHHQDADTDFSSCQANELLDHLETVLVNEPVVVNRDHQIVEVKPQGVSKGLVTEKILRRMLEDGRAPDFVVCIGDGRSDEEMFESITTTLSTQSSSMSTEIFTCTVGRKPSKAKYFLDEVSDVVKLLQQTCQHSEPKV